jgi:hypothetical protein
MTWQESAYTPVAQRGAADCACNEPVVQVPAAHAVHTVEFEAPTTSLSDPEVQEPEQDAATLQTRAVRARRAGSTQSSGG